MADGYETGSLGLEDDLRPAQLNPDFGASDERAASFAPGQPSYEPQTQDLGLGLAGNGGMDDQAFTGSTAGVGPDAGLGLATPGSASPIGRQQSDIEYLQSLPTMAKIGLMLQSFSAGVAGKANPIDQVLQIIINC